MMRTSKILLISLIILALNGAFLLTQIYLWQSSLLYLELYEALLEDIHLIDIPAIILDELPLYFLVTNIIFFILIAAFLFNLSPKLVNTIPQEEFVLNNRYVFNNLKERSPPLKLTILL
jgi:cellulose synthase/poly-beta-1,6-N-acetylglucosamine synthase-like glycosyltransferase